MKWCVKLGPPTEKHEEAEQYKSLTGKCCCDMHGKHYLTANEAFRRAEFCRGNIKWNYEVVEINE